MKTLLASLTIPALLLAFSVQSIAQTPNSTVIKLNDSHIAGRTDDGFNINYVPSTNNFWLDSAATAGLTTSQVKQRIATENDPLQSFRYATQAEIDSLMRAYGLPASGEALGAAAALGFMDDFGKPPGSRTMKGPGVVLVWPVSDSLNQYKQIISETANNKSSVAMGGIDPESQSSHFLVYTNGQTMKNNNSRLKAAVNDRHNLYFDSGTRLNWLDITSTLGLSTNQVKQRLANPNDALYGFRYATQNEIDALLKYYGMPSNGETPGDSSALTFMYDYGSVPGGQTMKGPSTTAAWPVSDNLSQLKQIIAHTPDIKSSVSQGGYGPDDSSGAIGHFLVKSL